MDDLMVSDEESPDFYLEKVKAEAAEDDDDYERDDDEESGRSLVLRNGVLPVPC